MVVWWYGASVELPAVLGFLGLNHVVSRWVNKLCCIFLFWTDKHLSISWLTHSTEGATAIFFFWLSNWNIRHICSSNANSIHFFGWLQTGMVDCPVIYCIFPCAVRMFDLCAIVLSITAWKIGILHHCLVIVAFPCKVMFEMSNMCLRNVCSLVCCRRPHTSGKMMMTGWLHLFMA